MRHTAEETPDVHEIVYVLVVGPLQREVVNQKAAVRGNPRRLDWAEVDTSNLGTGMCVPAKSMLQIPVPQPRPMTLWHDSSMGAR